VELDHLFICTSAGAPEGNSLIEAGLTEGSPNRHPGQGTACRRFFFHNVYLEMLWVSDPAEAQSEQSRGTFLWERWSGRNSGACPVGFCFRPAAGREEPVPFRTWQYRPAYLPDPLAIEIAANAGVLTEPMLCYLSFAQRPDTHSGARRQPLAHPAGFREVTRVTFATPHKGNSSPELQSLASAGAIRLGGGTDYLVEIGIDRESQRQRLDCRPMLPLVIYW